MMDNQNYDENLMDGEDPGMLNDYNDEDMLINDDGMLPGHDMQDMGQDGDDNYFYN